MTTHIKGLEVLSQLAEGGQCCIFLALDHESGQQRALKSVRATAKNKDREHALLN